MENKNKKPIILPVKQHDGLAKANLNKETNYTMAVKKNKLSFTGIAKLCPQIM